MLLQIGGNVPPPATVRKGGAGGGAQASAESKSSSELSPLLQISSLHLRDMVWKPELVNTTGLLNRQYHASVAVSDSSVLVFGGTVTAIGNGQVAEEILEINRTIFGLSVSVVKTERATCSLQGLSAVTSFSLPEGVALLYGGCTKDKRSYSSDLSLFLHRGDLALEGVGEGEGMVVLQVEGGAEGAPPARAFHRCSLTGPNGDVLLVHGGQSKSGELLGDVWMCDLSGVVAALSEAAAPRAFPSEPGTEGGGGSGEEKGPVKLPHVKWLCLLESSATVSPRYLHSGVAFVSTRDDLEPPAPCIQFGVFGGSTTSAKSAGIEYFEACLMLADDGVSYTAQDFVLRESLPLPPRTALNGAALATVGSGNAPVGAVVFFCGSVGLLKVLNDASDLAVGMRRAVARSASSSAETKKEASATSTGVGLPKKVRYAEGVYEGQLKRPPGETDVDPIVPEALLRHGRGTLRLSSGETYEGNWSEGARQGQGTQTLGAEVYEGGFWADQRQGHGILSVSGTVVYEGEFLQGLFGGIGTQTADDGVYRGEFVAGKRHGQGCLTNHDTGYVYDGAWAAGAISGVGRVRDLPVCEASSSSSGGLQGVYQGPTLDGIPSGVDGFCAYQDGSEYMGEWKSGKRNGAGRFTHKNNDEFEGKWVGDQRWKGRWTSAQGNEYYDGYWQNNRPHGSGLRLYAQGEIVTGEWACGKRVGISMQATADVKQWG